MKNLISTMLEDVMKVLVNSKPITHKEIQAMSKGKKYPYEEVANKLNNLSESELDTIDRIVAEGELTSMKMVGIKKLYNMVKTTYVKERMKQIYNL